jgi:pimeloyl-ACP methyl ester carboxylesterase
MSAESVSPISTYFRVCDGVRVRFADTKADSDITVLMLSPWPESLWAFRRIWHQVAAVGRVVAIDLPLAHSLVALVARAKIMKGVPVSG